MCELRRFSPRWTRYRSYVSANCTERAGQALCGRALIASAGDEHLCGHRRRRLPRLPPLRAPARQGAPGDLHRQPRDRLAAEHRAHPRRRLRVPQHRHHRVRRHPRGRRLRLPPGLAGQPDRLPAAAAAHAQGRLARHPPHARRGQVQARPLPDRLDQRGLRRPPGPPADGGLLGPRQPDRPARRLRRGQALRRGADDGLPPPAGRRHLDRPHLQHLRPADARPRRPRDPDLPAPGAPGPAADRLRRRQPDAQLLLRRRPDPRHRRPRRVRRAHRRSTSATRTSSPCWNWPRP